MKTKTFALDRSFAFRITGLVLAIPLTIAMSGVLVAIGIALILLLASYLGADSRRRFISPIPSFVEADKRRQVHLLALGGSIIAVVGSGSLYGSLDPFVRMWALAMMVVGVDVLFYLSFSDVELAPV